MPQLCKVSQQPLLWNQFIHPDSGACRPPIPNQGDHRFRRPGKTGRHAPERLVGMLWNGWTASIGIDGRHGLDYATIESLLPAASFPQSGLVSALFFAGAIAMAGLPPLSGFVGKLLILASVRGYEAGVAAWAIVLLTSLVFVIGFTRAGIIVFWQTQPAAEGKTPDTAHSPLPFVAGFGLLGMIVLTTLLAQPLMAFLNETAQEIYNPAAYINAVLPRAGGQTP